MTVNDIYTFLNDKYDFALALPYDNVGHLVGSLSSAVTGIVVCLDCTEEAVTVAVENGANLIVSHHPVIFDPLKSVTEESIIYRLIRNDISVISAHTNLDQADGGVNDALCLALELTNIEKVTDSEGFVFRLGELNEPLSADEFASFVSKKLNLRVKYVGNNSAIKRVAVCSGSGGSMLADVATLGVDAYVTADIKHNVLLSAHELGLVLIDAGHFETEDPVVAHLAKALQKEFPQTKVIENHFTPIKYTK